MLVLLRLLLCGGVVASGVIGGAFDCVVYDVVVVVLVGGVNAVVVVVGVSAFLVFVGTFTMKIVVTVVVVDFSLLSVSINI